MPTVVEMTPKQRRFVDEYLIDANGSRAALAAGYGRAGAKVTAHRLTHANQAVQAEIRARQGVDRQRLQIERQDVISGLLQAVEIARAQRNAAGLISAWSSIARLLGMYAPERHHVDITSAGELAERGRVEAMSDAELLTMMAGQGQG